MVAQLKETLKKERGEIQNLKRKYEDMIGEAKVSKVECQILQVDKDAIVISRERIENNSQATSAELGKLQLEYQSMKAKKDKFLLLVGELNEENNRLEGKVIELEMYKSTAEEKEKLYQTQIAALEDQKNSLAASLKSAMEHKVDI